MTHDGHFNIVRMTGISNIQMPDVVGCECIHTLVNGCQLTVYHTAGVGRELHDHVFAVSNWNPPWSAKAFERTVREIEHHDVVRSGIVVDDIREKHLREWTKQASITSEEAKEAYLVDVIVASHCLK
jgi:hypothetical protein